MLISLLIGALVVGQGGSEPAPVFHAEAYVVTNFIVFGKQNGPVTRGLTADNFRATVNKKLVAIAVSEDPKEPGSYVLSINPPLELRDGKSHRIDVQIRNWGKADDKWRDLPVKWTAVFTKPGPGLRASGPEVPVRRLLLGRSPADVARTQSPPTAAIFCINRRCRNSRVLLGCPGL